MKKSIIVILLLTLFSFGYSQGENKYSETKSDVELVRYNFSFVSMSAQSVFMAIGAAAEVDIVPSPMVTRMKGISLHVTQKTWQEVIEIVCNLYDLHWIVEDKYLFVQTKAEHEKKLDDEATRIKKEENNAVLYEKIIYLNNAELTEMEKLARDLLKGTKGTVSTISRNNALVVSATASKMKKLELMIASLDVETKQVAITAKLVVVDSKLLRTLGVDWTTQVGSGSPALGNLAGSSRNAAQIVSTPLGVPLAPTGGNIYTGLLQGDITLTLAQMLRDEKSEVLASPQISTLDHVQAKVFMGEEKSVRTVDDKGVAAFQTQEAGISLTVTPHITQDNRIRLELKPENNSFSLDAQNQLVIQRQEAETEVVVYDGETVVIAGLTSNQEYEVEAGIPFLKDIPLLGFLFKSTRTEIAKKDLIIFVTPHILKSIVKKASVSKSTSLTEKLVEPIETQKSVETVKQ
tara:strand:- start:314 stop:1699 length:1386 start_codon:yes stop_codon:yes gene_type:complete